MIYLFLIFTAWLLFVFFVKPYIQQYDTVILYTGGLGSGKSLVSSKMALKLLRRNRRKVKWHNFLHPSDKWPEPQLYSNIAFRISKREWALQLTPGHMLCETKITPRSILFVDEICLFLDQFTIKLPASETVEEFATLYRHYTQGGYLIMNTQNSNKVNFHFRYCVNSALNLAYFKKWLPFPWLFYTVKVRNISLSDDIKKIEDGNREDGMSTLFGLRPLSKHYDTYTYSVRYREVPEKSEKRYTQFKTGKILRCPRGSVSPKTKDVEIFPEIKSKKLKKIKPSVEAHSEQE